RDLAEPAALSFGQAGEVVGDRQAHHAAADDQQVELGRELGGRAAERRAHGCGSCLGAGLAKGSGRPAKGSATVASAPKLTGWGGGRAVNGVSSSGLARPRQASSRATVAMHSLPWHGPVPNPV